MDSEGGEGARQRGSLRAYNRYTIAIQLGGSLDRQSCAAEN